MAELATAIRAGIGFATRAPEGFDAVNPGGNPSALADVLFRDYFFPFEVTSILLIVAAVAAMVLALRRSKSLTQREIEAHASDDLETVRRRAARRARIDAGADVVRTPIAYFLLLSAILFAMGSASVLLRRNALRIFMGVELQLNAVNLSLVAFSRMHIELDGQILAFFSMVVAAAEVVVGLAIIVAVFRRTSTTDVDRASVLRG